MANCYYTRNRTLRDLLIKQKKNQRKKNKKSLKKSPRKSPRKKTEKSFRGGKNITLGIHRMREHTTTKR